MYNTILSFYCSSLFRVLAKKGENTDAPFYATRYFVRPLADYLSSFVSIFCLSLCWIIQTLLPVAKDNGLSMLVGIIIIEACIALWASVFCFISHFNPRSGRNPLNIFFTLWLCLSIITSIIEIFFVFLYNRWNRFTVWIVPGLVYGSTGLVGFFPEFLMSLLALALLIAFLFRRDRLSRINGENKSTGERLFPEKKDPQRVSFPLGIISIVLGFLYTLSAIGLIIGSIALAKADTKRNTIVATVGLAWDALALSVYIIVSVFIVWMPI